MPTDFQFLGIDETLAAYNARDVDQWGLFAGNRFIMKGWGNDQLKSFLEMIARSGTTSVYTLKVYEDPAEGLKITSKTADDGSFNFKLFSTDGRGQLSGIIGTHYGDPVQMQILERLGALEEQGADDTPGVMGQITDAFIGMLQEPRKLQDFLNVIQGRPVSGSDYNVPRTIGAIPGPGAMPGGVFEITEDNAPKISAAVMAIGKTDKKVVDHLEQLARMATDNPEKFKMLIGLLDAGF